MESRLLVVFKNVNEWLRFAEAKNAMIIAFNGVVFFGVARLIKLDEIKDIKILLIYLYICFIFLGFSTLVAILSFVPQLKQIVPSMDFKSENDNYLFFMTLKDKKTEEIINIYNSEDETNTPFHRHLAEQIITNSGITKRKYDHFTFACWLTIASIMTPVVAVLYALYNYKNN